MTDQVSQPHKITGKIIRNFELHISIQNTERRKLFVKHKNSYSSKSEDTIPMDLKEKSLRMCNWINLTPDK